MITLLIIAAIILPVPIIGLVRNEKVYKLRMWLVDEHIFSDVTTYKEKMRIFKKVSYCRMAFDLFTPIKLESYWSESDIATLLNSVQNAPVSDTSKDDSSKDAGNLFTTDQIRQAGKDGEISSIDVEHLINVLLREAAGNINNPPLNQKQ